MTPATQQEFILVPKGYLQVQCSPAAFRLLVALLLWPEGADLPIEKLARQANLTRTEAMRAFKELALLEIAEKIGGAQ